MKDMKDKEKASDEHDEREWDNYYQWRRWRQHHHHYRHGGGGSAVYGLGFIGALIFFIGQATTFWTGVLGFFQALVWPAYLVYEALKVLIK
ncbi:MAG TPA: hypothetical protein VMR16_02335 [Candidatus Saccharimonadales bacterium]|nr:hypothetical protein [Candidatus Saccharimonadales bacterium]